ncbi:MAG: FAD-dependent oxidoreductase [Candidatus Methanofastidiosia archaeon]
MMKIVIVGFGTGGYSAALAATKYNPKARVLILEKKSYELISVCGMPYVLEDLVEIQKLKHEIVASRVEKLLNHEVSRIDVEKKKVFARNLAENKDVEVSYDKLILATGTKPFIPPIKGLKRFLSKGVYLLETLEDLKRLLELASSSKKCVVIGASAIGLETSLALKRRGLSVTLIEALYQVFQRGFDYDMARLIENYISEEGVFLRTNTQVEEVFGEERARGVAVEGERIETDFILLSCGVKPNIELASTGIKIGRLGIRVNERMETSAKDVYAIGDCAEVFSLIDKKPILMQLAISAYRQGVIAGTNATGGNLKYSGALNTFVSLVGNLEIAGTGFNSLVAEERGYKILTSKARGFTKTDYFPKSERLTLKLVVDEKTKRILGGQVVGGRNSSWRVNVLACAIKAGMTLNDLSNLELCYNPPVSETYDVLLKAADLGVRRGRR